MTTMWRVWRAAAQWATTQQVIELQELMLAIGTLCLCYGISYWSTGAAFVAAGVIVLALHWPPSEPREPRPVRKGR